MTHLVPSDVHPGSAYLQRVSVVNTKSSQIFVLHLVLSNVQPLKYLSQSSADAVLSGALSHVLVWQADPVQ